jgi:hypothetical protein
MRKNLDRTITIEPSGSAELGPCGCCGTTTRRVWGWAHRGDTTEAAYFVEWTPNSVAKHGAMFDLILGRFGEGATAADRVAVSLAYRVTDGAPGFMIVDAAKRHTGQSALVGQALDRSAVLPTALSKQAFDVVDAIWLNDPRINELVSAAA